MKYLADVNVLLAAINVDHPLHSKADAWVQGKSLVVCPLSELGFLRITSQPKAFGQPMSYARQALKDFIRKHGVEFSPADLPALESNPLRSGDVTDHYLADLAAARNCKLATLNAGINHKAIELIT